MIYLDHNATTPLDPRVLEAMLPYLTTLYGNPSSLYRLGRIARSAIDTAREQLASLIDTNPTNIIFTSGGTEANNLALANAGNQKVWISAIEHPSIFEFAESLQQPLSRLSVDCTGLIDLDKFAATIQSGDFVSIMLANNETGVIQPIAEIAETLANKNIIFHTDAVQALGKIPLSFKQLGVQMMSVSSHKIYGPKGCGALVVSDGIRLQGRQRGGDQERGLRAGTENVAAMVGFGKAAELAQQAFSERSEKLLALKTQLEQQLLSLPNLVIFSEHSPRLPNTVQFAIEGLSGEMLLMQLDQKSIAVSSGSACASGSEAISPVLAAMSIKPSLAKAAIRVSLGKDNTEQEIHQFVSILKTLLR
ncbi:MAG: cysteine desulfurase family protein [Methylomonas sp.]